MNDVSILIVEDEQRLADILKRQLEESGFTAEIAYDGYVGKQLAEKKIMISSYLISTCRSSMAMIYAGRFAGPTTVPQ